MPDTIIKTDVRFASFPTWARELITLYESGANNQFILYGNVNDRYVLPVAGKAELGTLRDFLLRVLLPKFDVVLSYDLGNGLRIENGSRMFSEWPSAKALEQLPESPIAAIELLTRYFRYCLNLKELKTQNIKIGCIVNGAQLIAPNVQYALNYDLGALAYTVRDWSVDRRLAEHNFATFLITENINDLHSLIANNVHAAKIKLPLPNPEELSKAISIMAPSFPVALKQFENRGDKLGQELAGTTIQSVEALLKTKQYKAEKLQDQDLVRLKKAIIENEANGLIEFIGSNKTLDDIYGQEKLKKWIRQDINLWKNNDIQALPMGYLLCGPVGTGKTFLVECIAGEAGVPVVKIKNFRDKWVGSSEGNLERIFRLLHALGRCFVFVDEADQSLGKRVSGADDSGVSGRLYSMMAEEMGNTQNRGKIIWVLASSRPDLIEVDLKRPGRIDFKIPLFPTTTPEEGFTLIKALCKRRGLEITEADFSKVKECVPLLLTPGAAETLAVKIYRLVKTQNKPAGEVLENCLRDYQSPVSKDIMDFQIQLAVKEASDLDFVPEVFRNPLRNDPI